MVPHTSVEALADAGLVGDRYSDAAVRRGPDYQLTLIEIENINGFRDAVGYPMTPDQPRRNLVTAGIRLNDLNGKRFMVGSVLCEALDLCEPCMLLKARTHPEALRYFVGRGGLRARILVGGTITVGDAITTVV